MDMEIFLPIIVLSLFVVAAGLLALVKWRTPRSVFVRALIVIELFLSVLALLSFGVYEVVSFLIEIS